MAYLFSAFSGYSRSLTWQGRREKSVRNPLPKYFSTNSGIYRKFLIVNMSNVYYFQNLPVLYLWIIKHVFVFLWIVMPFFEWVLFIQKNKNFTVQ